MSSKIIPGEMILEGSIPDGQMVNAPKKTFASLDDTPLAELQVTGRIYSGTLTITASSDTLDVSDVNTVFINITGDIILGGLVGGVDGQRIEFAIIGNFTNHCRFEHQEGIGGGTQDFINHTGADEDIDGGGCIYVCNGTNWYDVSHAKHV